MQRSVAIVALAGAVLAGAACRAPLGGPRAPLPLSVAAIERGALTYEIYCGGCHGADGRGYGPFALAFGLTPADLRAPALAAASDAALLDRLLDGTPIVVPPRATRAAETRDLDALVAYLPRVAHADWNVLRAGRVVYDDACAACHGVYGRGDTAIASWFGVPGMIDARERQSDAALARISEHGIGVMPPLSGAFDRTEVRALVAYVRHLSDGFAVYDARCASCHGDDGRGLDADDLVPPAVAAPALRGPYDRARLRAMLAREHGLMPHFAALDCRRLADVVAYLRAVVFDASTDAPR